jgi:hypothetical protein
VHHRYLQFIDMRLLAFLAIRLAQFDAFSPTNRQELLARIEIEDHPDLETHFQTAQDNHVQGGATVVLIKLMEKLPVKIKENMKYRLLRKEAMQTYSDVAACGALDTKTHWRKRARIMGHCVKAALGDHTDIPSYEQMLARIDVQLNPFKDAMIECVVHNVVLAKLNGTGKGSGWGLQIQALAVRKAKERTRLSF